MQLKDDLHMHTSDQSVQWIECLSIWRSTKYKESLKVLFWHALCGLTFSGRYYLSNPNPLSLH